MPHDITPWQSPDSLNNAIALRAKFAQGFRAVAELDRIGHLLLHRAGSIKAAARLETVVGIALLRRAVTLFTGIRTLLEASLPDVAKAPARAYFELWLHHRCLAYGSAQPISLETPTLPDEREARARRYHIAAERRGIRSRASVLAPNSKFPPKSPEERDALVTELVDEIARLRGDYLEEWQYFGDVTEATALKHVGGIQERPWFAGEFPGQKINSIARLASAYDCAWDYEFLYDAFSALVHSRGTGHDVTFTAHAVEVHHPHNPTWFEVIAYFVNGWHQMFLMTAAKWHYPEMVPQLQHLFERHGAALKSMEPRTMPNLLA